MGNLAQISVLSFVYLAAHWHCREKGRSARLLNNESAHSFARFRLSRRNALGTRLRHVATVSPRPASASREEKSVPTGPGWVKHPPPHFSAEATSADAEKHTDGDVFTDDISPPTDSTCSMPTLGRITDVPPVAWKACDSDTPTFAHDHAQQSNGTTSSSGHASSVMVHCQASEWLHISNGDTFWKIVRKREVTNYTTTQRVFQEALSSAGLADVEEFEVQPRVKPWELWIPPHTAHKLHPKTSAASRLAWLLRVSPIPKDGDPRVRTTPAAKGVWNSLEVFFNPENATQLQFRCGKHLNVRSKSFQDVDKRRQILKATSSAKPQAQDEGKNNKKYSILHIFPDAMARAAFFRNNLGWSRTVDFLQQGARSEGGGGSQLSGSRLFAFTRYVSEGMSTQQNTMPMFAGVPLNNFALSALSVQKHTRTQLDGVDLDDAQARYVAKQRAAAIHFESAKYGGPKTVFLHEHKGEGVASSHSFLRSSSHWLWDEAVHTGHRVFLGCEGGMGHMNALTDFSNVQFATGTSNDVWNDYLQPPVGAAHEMRKMQCVGDRHIIATQIEEALQFLHHPGDEDDPKLVSVKFGQAHNRWPDGNQVDDLALNFLRRAYNKKQQLGVNVSSSTMSTPDLITWLVADHGYGYLDRWENNVKKYPGSDFERLLPLMALLLPGSLMNRLREDRAALLRLEKNQRRLVTAYDFHLTALAIMQGWPAMIGDPRYWRRCFHHFADVAASSPTSTSATESGGTEEKQGCASTALNLLAVEVPANRTCEEAGISRQSCVCNAWEPITNYAHDPDTARAWEAAIDFLNSFHHRERTGKGDPTTRLKEKGRRGADSTIKGQASACDKERPIRKGCRLVTKDGTIIDSAMKKEPVEMGYNHLLAKRGPDKRFRKMLKLELRTLVARSRWQITLEEVDLNNESRGRSGKPYKVVEVDALHRYHPRKACQDTDGGVPLKFCDCGLV